MRRRAVGLLILLVVLTLVCACSEVVEEPTPGAFRPRPIQNLEQGAGNSATIYEAQLETIRRLRGIEERLDRLFPPEREALDAVPK